MISFFGKRELFRKRGLESIKESTVVKLDIKVHKS